MQCYTDILPPTGVTHSLALPLTKVGASNLVVARTSVLQIFNVYHHPESEHAKLSLVAEYHLEGTISALGRVKPLVSKTGADALLIAFRHAKLTLVEWNPQQYSLSTISIHYYENLNLSSCPWSPDDSHCLTHLTVDPSSRCAAFNFNLSSLAIIPFHQLNDDLDVDHLDGLDNQDKQNHVNGDSHATPYAPSFVLPVTALEPDLLHPRTLAFLHGYGDPALGVLYTSAATSNNLDPIRRDVVTYAVYTLDLDQKASTTLLAVKKLPNDLHSIVPVPTPIGGALLIGANDVLHVDQSGKVNAVAVNEFAKECSSFHMADQSNLEYRLEGCQAIALQNHANQVLLVLANGAFAVLSFRIDGRNVSGISLHALETSASQKLLQNRCSTLTALSHDHIFIGCEEADSALLHVSQNTSNLKRQTSRMQPNGHDSHDVVDDEDSMEDDEDDLYGDGPITGPSSLQSLSHTINLQICDKLSCIAPIHNVAVGRPGISSRLDEDEPSAMSISPDKLDLVLASNSSCSGSLVIVSTELKPQIIRTEASFTTKFVWTLSNQSRLEGSSTRPYDDVLIVSSGEDEDDRSTSIFTFDDGVLTELDATDFQSGDLAVATGKLAIGSHVVVYSKEVRAYNSEFALDQIVPVVDDEANPPATAKVVSASVVDHCILLLKDDATVTFLRADQSGDLDEVTLPDKFPSSNVVAACLYDDSLDYFNTARFKTDKDVGRPVLVAIMTEEGILTLHTVFNLSVEVFRASGLSFLPLHLSPDVSIPKHWRNNEEVVEILICDLGPIDHRQPYLVVRSSIGDLTIYQPYPIPGVTGSYRFTKLSCHNADARQVEIGTKPGPSQMVAMGDLHGLATVWVTGKFPKLIVKTHEIMPAVFALGTGPVKGVTSFHDSSCDRGLAYTDEQGMLHIAELPREIIYASSGWLFRRIPLDCELTSLVYYPRTQCYVLATCSQTPFHLPRDDEWHPEWDTANEKASESFLPTTTHSKLKLLSATSHAVISEFNFEDNEQVLDIKCLNLEISEVTHERKDMIVVGTGVTKGENVVTRGNIYIFDVVDVVPHPEIPESDLKLKLVSKEDVRGAVTALDGIGSQGFLLAAQGQKCMVRGLREDNAILPVAFMDMRFHVSVTKSLEGTGLTILGDMFSGLWLAGYSEEPYKLQLLGRDLENPSVVTAEFLPQDKQLYIISSDGVGQLRVMQYDPESPLSERGTILLQRSTFNTGSFPTRMMLLPCGTTPSEVQDVAEDSEDEDNMELDVAQSTVTKHQVLVATQEGGLSLITPLSDQSYRRLNALQNILTTQLEQVCGLNPRAHRAVETDGLGGRAMIDGLVVRRWLEQSSQHKANLADRVGGSVWEIRKDLEVVLGGHLKMF